MDSQTKRAIDKLTTEIHNTRKRVDHMIGRKGGHIEGQLSVFGHIQFEAVGSIPATPAAGNIRVFARNNGGVLQLCALFPNGQVRTLAQE